MIRRPSLFALFPYTTLFRSVIGRVRHRPPFGLHHLVTADFSRPADHAVIVAGFEAGERGQAVHTRAKQRAEAERSEEHTSELQSLRHLVCRLLLEKKKKKEE